MAQLRSGTLKINVEIGRMSGLNLQERSCLICKDGSMKMSYMCYLGVMHTTKTDKFLCELCMKTNVTTQIDSFKVVCESAAKTTC